MSGGSSAAPSPAPTLVNSKAGRPIRASAGGTRSVSSAPTTLDASTDSEYSTRDTSNVPTPATSDSSFSKPNGGRVSIEVRLPARTEAPQEDRERALRKSIYALKSRTAPKNEVGDSDDEDDLSDTSVGAQAARRLQKEEYAKAGQITLNPSLPLRRSGRNSSSFAPLPDASASKAPIKRARASTNGSLTSSRPSKRSRTIPDSDELANSDIDMDAELAAAAAFEDEDIGELGFDDVDPAADSDEVDYDDEQSDDEEFNQPETSTAASGRGRRAMLAVSDSDDDDDDDFVVPEEPPLASQRTRKSIAKGKAPAKPRITTPRKRGPKAPRSLPASDLDDLLVQDGANLPTDESSLSSAASGLSSVDTSDSELPSAGDQLRAIAATRRAYRPTGNKSRLKKERDRLEFHHPDIKTMWDTIENMPVVNAGKIAQPTSISRQLKPFQLEGVAWMKEMENLQWKGGLLGDEMGLGKTIQAVSLIMSDYPAKQPSIVLVPPVALMQWQSEISSYTDGTLKTFVFHGTNQKTKSITVKELKRYDVIMMSYNSLESMYRKQEKGFKRGSAYHREKSLIHAIHFHRVILDEAHCIKTRTTMTAKACFALKTDYRWCLTGTPLQNRIGEFFSLIRFLNVRPFAEYLCKQCPCSTLEWTMDDDSRCTHCKHAAMQHVSVFNQELLNPIQRYGNLGPGREAFRKLRLMTDRIMLRRLKRDHTDSMELPVKEVYVDRQFFGEEENDFANSIMTNSQRKFDTYVAQGVLLNNYANIFGLIMQMRQVADHPDLLLKKHAEGGQNILVCSICDEPAEDTVRSRCKHDFCRACVSSYVRSTDEPDCPRCHISLSIDLEQPEIEQDENLVKKSSIINRIKMEEWTSSSKIELLVHELHKLRSNNAMHKSIIFSQFTTMLQLIEWRLRRAGITTVMLDGSMTPAQRQASIEHFMTNINVECFLVSLKAGGVALNLTEASRVFIVDP